MQRRIFKLAIALLWLALPLVALQYRQSWSQLPAHVATHFNAAGQANGWMGRDQAMQFGVGFMAVLLVIFTVVLLAASRSHVDLFSWAMLSFSALVVGFIVEVNRGIVAYNVNGSPMLPRTVLIAIPLAAIALIVIYVGTRRGPALAPAGHANELLVEETHTGGPIIFMLLLVLAAPAIIVAFVPSGPLRLSMALVCVIGLGTIAAAWSGFRYRFMQHGIEIRALGYRLRSIPRSAIVSYSIEPWNMLRGYGIRGVGNSRAYVWGSQVVHIKTTNGDVYLGHNDPQRIVHDLQLVTGVSVP